MAQNPKQVILELTTASMAVRIMSFVSAMGPLDHQVQARHRFMT
jgi:hypothetical protein